MSIRILLLGSSILLHLFLLDHIVSSRLHLQQYPAFVRSCGKPAEYFDTLLNRSEVIVAGRFRERLTDSGDDNVSDSEHFHASVLVTTRYKSKSKIPNLIKVGTFTTSSSTAEAYNGLGCLDTVYRNSKYIFFLRKQNESSHFYTITANPVSFTESLDRKIYADLCTDCYIPKVTPMSDQQREHGSNLTVACTAEGKPPPKLVWIKNGKSLNTLDETVSIETLWLEDHVESVLEITNLIRIDSGDYRCLASNPLGEASQSFNLRVNPPMNSWQAQMDSELIPCGEENRDYCLHGGQCYMLKSEREVLQCRCSPQYFGNRCRFHIGDVHAYGETRDAGVERIVKEFAHEVIAHLSWSIWGSFALTTLMFLYLILKTNKVCISFKGTKRSAKNQTRNRDKRKYLHAQLISQYSGLNNSQLIEQQGTEFSKNLVPRLKGENERISRSLPHNMSSTIPSKD